MSEPKAEFVPPVSEGRCRECGIRDHLIAGLCVTHWCQEMDRKEGVTYRYFVRFGDSPEQEVSKERWVAVERQAGFHNTLGHPEEPATAAFSTTAYGGIEGRKERVTPNDSQAPSL